MQLIIGNKNYSSWSLRSWLLLHHFNIKFTETKESLSSEQLSQRLNQYSPSNKVPVLLHNTEVIWDTLAIAEYVNEHLQGQAWPRQQNLRHYARCISAEMHSGFNHLRNAMPMNIRARRHVAITPYIQAEIDRIEHIFGIAREQHKKHGPWLAGTFSIADCMYAPVASRFKTYGITLEDSAQEYVDRIHGHPSMQQWVNDAMQETEIIPEDEAGEEVEQNIGL